MELTDLPATASGWCGEPHPAMTNRQTRTPGRDGNTTGRSDCIRSLTPDILEAIYHETSGWVNTECIYFGVNSPDTALAEKKRENHDSMKSSSKKELLTF